MFFGEHRHTIDEKSRLTLPAKWREELEAGVFVTRGLEDCLFVFTKAKFEVIAHEIEQQGLESADSRAWARYLAGMAEPADLDKQGRILIPQNLRDYAKLNGEVVIVGAISRIEVWNPERHKENKAAIESNAAAVAERMAQVMRRAAAPTNK